MSVTFVRQEVLDKQAAWKLVRDAVAGSEAVKKGDYIIEVNPTDASPQNMARNEQRVKRAVYFNATGRTLPALTGIAFSKWPDVKIPAAMDYLLKDVDGSGVGLINQAQLAVSEVLQTARAGLLVDYPATGEGSTAQDVRSGNVRPVVNLYPADAIVNWGTIRRGALSILGLVVIKETVEARDGFEIGQVDQYRVLQIGRLTGEDEWAPARYVVQIHQKDQAGDWVVVEEYAPTKANGQFWDRIPFTFIGATNNDATPDAPPLYDLADLNIAHFRNSADHEESLFFAGQAQVWLTGENITPEQIELMQKEGVYVGSRSIGIAPGGVVMLQAQPVSALAQEMAHKVELMAALGARLITPDASRTATEAAADDRTSHSVLSIVADNVSDAYRKALTWAAQFAGTSEDVDFTIGTEFAGLQFDAQQLQSVVAAVQGGMVPASDFYSYARSIGLIRADKSDSDVRDELEAQGPTVPALDDVEV